MSLDGSSSDISYIDESDADVLDPDVLVDHTERARRRLGRGNEGSLNDPRKGYYPDRWSFDTEEIARSANLILSGLGKGDDGVLVEGVGDGRGDKLARLDGCSALQTRVDEAATTSGGPPVVNHEYDASSYAMLTHAELVRLRQQLQQSSLKQQTELRRFVKDNFAETIETIDTVRDVVAGVKTVTGWQDARGDHGGNGEHGGSSYQALASAIVELDEEAEEAFRGYVERVGMSENLNTVVQLFGAYDGLIVLPGLLRGRADAGDWEGFVRGCEKAASEIRGMAPFGLDASGHLGDHSSELARKERGTRGESDGEIWVKLEEEVVKAAERGAGLLLGVLEGVGGRGISTERDSRRQMAVCMENIQRGADAACYLDRLKRLSGLSLANLRRVDVLSAFVEGQVAGVLGLLSRQMEGSRRPLGDVVSVVSGMSRFLVAWCRGYREMCMRMQGMRLRDAANAPFAESLIESEGHAETSTLRRVFSGYAEMVNECVGRMMASIRDANTALFRGAPDSASAASPSPYASPSSSSSAPQLLDALMRLVRESEQVIEVLSDELGSWCVDEEAPGMYEGNPKDGRGGMIGKLAKSPRKNNPLLRGAMAASASTQSPAAIAVPLTPQIRDLFSHVIEHMLYVMEEYLRARIAPNVFLLRSSIAGDQKSFPRNQVHSIRINPGCIPRSNMALLHTSIDEVMHSMSRLVKHARLIHAPIGFKANAFLKAASAACSAFIVQYVVNLPLASTTGDREGANHVDEFILLAACKTLETIKTSLLPEIVTAHSSVLHLANATATENSDAFKWCCTQLEDGQESLMKRWVEIKLQKLEPVMNTILDVSIISPEVEDPPAAGEGGDEVHRGSAAPGDDTVLDRRDGHQPQAAVLELIAILEAYDADMIAMTPLLRDEVIGEMYLAVVEGLRDMVTSDGFAAAGTKKARRQTLADAKAIETWLVAQLGRDDADAVMMCQDVIGQLAICK